MSFIRDTRSVEQQHFFDGQRLLADDLQGIEAFNREMRWLHNQSLHQPGIGNGFAVRGKKDDRIVTVGPGYAIDDRGREIVLTSDRELPVPPVAGDGGSAKHYVLTVAYPDDVDLEMVEQRLGICADPGATRLRVEPVFCWQPLNPDGTPVTGARDIVIGRQLTLAEIAVKDCKLYSDVSIATRRNAKPANQPYIYAGEEQPTKWKRWQPSVDVATDRMRFVVAAEAWIDTSEAGFLGRPEYFSRIAGDRVLRSESGEEAAQIIDGMIHIAESSSDGFLARVFVFLLNGGFSDGSVVERMIAAEQGDEIPLPWTVVWMGVEG